MKPFFKKFIKVFVIVIVTIAVTIGSLLCVGTVITSPDYQAKQEISYVKKCIKASVPNAKNISYTIFKTTSVEYDCGEIARVTFDYDDCENAGFVMIFNDSTHSSINHPFVCDSDIGSCSIMYEFIAVATKGYKTYWRQNSEIESPADLTSNIVVELRDHNNK